MERFRLQFSLNADGQVVDMWLTVFDDLHREVSVTSVPLDQTPDAPYQAMYAMLDHPMIRSLQLPIF